MYSEDHVCQDHLEYLFRKGEFTKDGKPAVRAVKRFGRLPTDTQAQNETEAAAETITASETPSETVAQSETVVQSETVAPSETVVQSETVAAPKRVYKCSKCGKPEKGHVCGSADTAVEADASNATRDQLASR